MDGDFLSENIIKNNMNMLAETVVLALVSGASDILLALTQSLKN